MINIPLIFAVSRAMVGKNQWMCARAVKNCVDNVKFGLVYVESGCLCLLHMTGGMTASSARLLAPFDWAGWAAWLALGLGFLGLVGGSLSGRGSGSCFVSPSPPSSPARIFVRAGIFFVFYLFRSGARAEPSGVGWTVFSKFDKLWIIPLKINICKILEFLFFTVLSLDEPRNFKFQAQPQTQNP